MLHIMNALTDKPGWEEKVVTCHSFVFIVAEDLFLGLRRCHCREVEDRSNDRSWSRCHAEDGQLGN